MFSCVAFEQFIVSNMNTVVVRKGSISREHILNSLVQLSNSPSTFLINIYSNKTRSDISKAINKYFVVSNILVDKPRNVQINLWLLYKLGFKICSITGEVLSINEFHVNSSSWDGRSSMSKIGEAKYRSENLGKKRNRDAKRNANKLNATPSWLSTEQKLEILKIYEKASIQTATTGIKYEVDHIIPLQGVEVCGLHVPWNLQILTKSENCSKSNKLI